MIAASNFACGKGLMQLFLEHHGNEFSLSERILQAAVRNAKLGEEVIRLLIYSKWTEF